ncbi:hypothetical protein MKW92_034019, partial [Papaver armeniacum]
MHHSSIDPYVTATLGYPNLTVAVLFMCLFELSGNKGGDLGLILCGVVVACGRWWTSGGCCGGRCLYTGFVFKRGYARRYIIL